LGTVLAWSSPALPDLEEDRSSKIGFLDSRTQSWISSISPFGGLISAPLACILIFRIGPKTSMLIMSAPFVLGWLLIAYAQNLTMLFIGRFVTGIWNWNLNATFDSKLILKFKLSFIYIYKGFLVVGSVWQLQFILVRNSVDN